MHVRTQILFTIPCALVVACGPLAATPDARSPDAGTSDRGALDAGSQDAEGHPAAAPQNDASPSTEDAASPSPTIHCGMSGQTCARATEDCCWTYGTEPEPDRAGCVPRGTATCSAGRASCENANQCGAGEVCCGYGNGDQTCSAAAACRAPDAGTPFTYCHDRSDCPSEAPYCFVQVCGARESCSRSADCPSALPFCCARSNIDECGTGCEDAQRCRMNADCPSNFPVCKREPGICVKA